MAKIVYYSRTGQTRKMVNKVDGYEAIEVTLNEHEFSIDEPFIFVVPSYEIHVMPAVIKSLGRFLRTGDNIKQCRGIMGGGNRNFAELFCITAHMLSDKFDIPVLHEFEFQGSEYDINILKEELDKIDE